MTPAPHTDATGLSLDATDPQPREAGEYVLVPRELINALRTYVSDRPPAILGDGRRKRLELLNAIDGAIYAAEKAAAAPQAPAPSADDRDMQQCESCSRSFPIETCTHSEDCWFCQECYTEFKAAFDKCEHQWKPHVNSYGEEGRVCEKCSGFVADVAPVAPDVSGPVAPIAQANNLFRSFVRGVVVRAVRERWMQQTEGDNWLSDACKAFDDELRVYASADVVSDLKRNLRHWREECGKLHARLKAPPANAPLVASAPDVSEPVADDPRLETDYCMCGSHMDDHDIGSGHAPVSVRDYYAAEVEQEKGVSDSTAFRVFKKWLDRYAQEEKDFSRYADWVSLEGIMTAKQRREISDVLAGKPLIASAPDALEKALEGLQSIIAVTFGRGPDAVIPETIPSALGIPIKLGDAMRAAEKALSSHRAGRTQEGGR